MFEHSKKIYVACSGGPDSTALFCLLTSYCKQHSIELGVIHVNHGLRGQDSDQDEKWVRKLDQNAGVHFISGKVNVAKEAKKKRLSIEEAARDMRYRFLTQSAKCYRIDTITLGHTMDDQAETVLMRFLTGSGLRGFGGSRPVFKSEGVRFVRPLIEIPKKEVLDFLKLKKMSYRTDRSNQSTQFLRNKIRLELLPYLEKKFSPGIRKVLARLPEVIQSDTEFLEQEARKEYQKLAIFRSLRAVSKTRRSNLTQSVILRHEPPPKDGSVLWLRRIHNRRSFTSFRMTEFRNDGRILFPKGKFSKLHPALQFRLLQYALMSFTREEFGFTHWQAFKELFSRKSEFRISFPGHIDCAVSKSKISIGHAKPETRTFSDLYALRLNNSTLIPEIGKKIQCKILSQKPRVFKKHREDYAIIDRSKINFPLTIRRRLPGDSFQPLGQAKPSKLKDFLIRRKIPREKRDSLPLVLSRNEIVWIGGVAISDRVKATNQTKNFIKLEVIPSGN